MYRLARTTFPAIMALCLAFRPSFVNAADPSAPARDNAPRIWQAISGERVELDGQSFYLRGVSCPATTSADGRRAKALLNTFLRGTKYNQGIACTAFTGSDGRRSVDCIRKQRRASDLLIASSLCQPRPTIVGAVATQMALARNAAGNVPLSLWRLRTCLGARPGHVPTQCPH